MATQEKILNKLRHLEMLYRQGYRSDVIEQSLDKIIALELATARRELTELQQKLRVFETRYQMSSDIFYGRFRAGELGDAVDFVEWSIFYEMWQSVRERLEILQRESM